MKNRIRSLAVLACALVLSLSTLPGVAGAQEGEPPFMRNFFPPELVMQNQRAISLRKDQRKAITKAIQSTQSETIELQWEMQEAAASLEEAVAVPKIDEGAAIAIAEKMMEVEGRVKRAHLALLIRIRNVLDPDQRERLAEIREGR